MLLLITICRPRTKGYHRKITLFLGNKSFIELSGLSFSLCLPAASVLPAWLSRSLLLLLLLLVSPSPISDIVQLVLLLLLCPSVRSLFTLGIHRVGRINKSDFAE